MKYEIDLLPAGKRPFEALVIRRSDDVEGL